MTGASAPIDSVPRLSNRIDRLRLRHLRLLEAISDEGSLSRAAQRLYLSQPVVTTMLHDLEDAFGATLVERSARGGRLSPAGARALERLRVALAFIDAAVSASGLDSALPVIRIGSHTLGAHVLLPRVLGRMHARGQYVHTTILEDSASRLIAALKAGRVDCVVGRLGSRVLGAPDQSAFYFRPIFQSRFVVVSATAHPLARKRKLSLGALLEQDWVGFPTGTYSRQIVDDFFLGHALPVPRHLVESTSVPGILETVAQTSMLTMIDADLIQDRVALGRVRPLRLATEPGGDAIHFVCQRAALEQPGMLLLLEALQDLSDHRSDADPRAIQYRGYRSMRRNT